MYQSTTFNPKWKLWEHIIVFSLAILVIVLTGVYINMVPFITRSEIMAIPFAVKSIIIITYQLLTEHTRRFAKWQSKKANFILNSIEPVFWITLVILKFMGISASCSRDGCSVNWVIALFALFIFILSIHIAIISFVEYPASSLNTRRRSTRVHPVAVNRRSHAKSRTGCRTCKRRRIKCDENKPSCRNCERYAVTCDFIKSQVASTSTPASSHEGRGIAGPGCSLPTSQLQGSMVSSCDINMVDLELMHNFTTYTCTTMASDPAVRQLLRTTAVHMAVDCEYIMRSILAVSALHLSRYRPRKKDLYLERAMQHHQAASSAAIEQMTNLRAEECERLHIFSMLTVYYALGCPVNEVDLAPESPLIPHWLRLLHGMEPILCMLEPQKYRGVLTPLFDFGRRRMTPFLKSTPPRDPSLLVDVQTLVHRTCTDTDLIPIYDDMIEQLRRMLGLLLTPPRSSLGVAYAHPNDGSLSPSINVRREDNLSMSTPESSTSAAAVASPAWNNLEAWDILIWQWTQGKDFLPLLEAVLPPQEALVIFVYCLLVLRKLENQWWVEGWANHLMGKTWALLDEEHRHWVGWATEEMGWIPPR
ncbi:Sterol uptake control protein 2 [Madurella fahalii]|uniref:Sterol uptake control protein 2 n=1 Tax=Madurella fahalii TaxID=1157608 RepID=A0ABQ0FX76_9PEZI